MGLFVRTHTMIAALIAALPVVGVLGWLQKSHHPGEARTLAHVSSASSADLCENPDVLKSEDVFYVSCGGFY